MKAAAIQTVSTPRVEENLATAAALLEQAACAGAELAVLPEYFCLFGHSDADKLLIAEPFGQGPLQEWLAGQARMRALSTPCWFSRPKAAAPRATTRCTFSASTTASAPTTNRKR